MLARLHPLPDFLILGAQKGGTTSLFAWLSEHPDLRPASKKEVHFFDNNFERGEGWYRRHFPPRWRRRSGDRTGEATPSYLFAPRAPERVAALLPAARFVALLRDPVKRAYSHYHHNVRMNREPRPFEECVRAECAALDGDAPAETDRSFRRGAYVERGVYVDQLERWAAAVGRERLMVSFSDDLFRAPDRTLADVARFVGLAPHDFGAGAAKEGREARNKHPYAPLDRATAERLAAWFEPHDARLAAWLSRPVPWR